MQVDGEGIWNFIHKYGVGGKTNLNTPSMPLYLRMS
jgi:hypothetical protein